MERRRINLNDDIINEERVRKCLKRMKCYKATGPDGLKAEILKNLGESKQMMEEMIISLRGTLDTGQLITRRMEKLYDKDDPQSNKTKSKRTQTNSINKSGI